MLHRRTDIFFILSVSLKAFMFQYFLKLFSNDFSIVNNMQKF